MKLTPNQHGLGAAAAYVGLLAAGMAVIYSLGTESRELAAKCISNGESAEVCSVRFYGR